MVDRVIVLVLLVLLMAFLIPVLAFLILQAVRGERATPLPAPVRWLLLLLLLPSLLPILVRLQLAALQTQGQRREQVPTVFRSTLVAILQTLVRLAYRLLRV